MSKHTPGPWVLDTIPTSVGICHRIGPFPPRRPDDVTVRHACLYADYPSASNPADEELEANARLIAAAPELLDALEDAVNRLTSSLILLKCDDDFIKKETAKARAAIAKATA
ncbi:TPA: hypothetical protein RG921_004299 [Pseudomonas aeruginosa]|nr:hypothetical protein [Pseudomonas aeruginosa]